VTPRTLISGLKKALVLGASVLVFAVPSVHAQEDNVSLAFLSESDYQATADWSVGKKRFVLFHYDGSNRTLAPFYVCLFQQPAFSNEIADKSVCRELRANDVELSATKNATSWTGSNGQYIMVGLRRGWGLTDKYVCLLSMSSNQTDFVPNALCKAK
jgi:hypothetical protein